jgi:transketolase
MNNTELQRKAKEFRKQIFKFKTSSGVGHLATCLSTVDVLTSVFYSDTTIFNKNKDKILFSKAHGSPALYPILADLGYITKEELDVYGTNKGRLTMHSDYTIPLCHFVGGSLGNGIGHAAGLAYKNDINIFVVLGDGELYEGSVWETLMFISHHNIHNIKLIVDRNNLCILGNTEEIIKLNPLDKKFEAFGFKVKTIDGHNYDQLNEAFSYMSNTPEVIITNTIKGKGVSYMENKWEYHTIIPKTKELIDKGLEELS